MAKVKIWQKFSNQICKNAEKRNSIVNVLLEKFHLDTDLHHMKSLHLSLWKQKSYHTVTVNSPHSKLVFPSWLILGTCHNFCSVRCKGHLSVIWHKPPAQYIAQLQLSCGCCRIRFTELVCLKMNPSIWLLWTWTILEQACSEASIDYQSRH